jgi:oxygen-independent coproporphyrinogen-3 oxidase
MSSEATTRSSRAAAARVSRDAASATGDWGVYVHVPFCAARCGYCDFATWTDRSHLIGDYVDACVTDLRRRVAGGIPLATSVFFGGGTPSLLPAASLVRILDEIPRAPGAEVTVECNPDSVEAAKLEAYLVGGVNRVSFGVQSFRPHVLAVLERTHDVDNVERAVAAARGAGFETFNLDVIYGTPGESLDDWRATLDGVLALEPPHVSAYALTVESGTPMARRVEAGELAAPDDDEAAEKYVMADEAFGAAGLSWYEVSNWARPGHECRHNLLYWCQGDYLAIGCAAHGHTAGRRWWNVRTPDRYLERIAAGEDPIGGEEQLDAATAAEEAFALTLRTSLGAVPSPLAEPVVRELVSAGLLERAPDRGGDRIVLTRRGRLLGGDVTARLLVGTR